MKKPLSILLIILTLTAGIILGLWQVKPPRLNEKSPDYPAFQRMMANIKRLASEPHPSGSDEIEIVRAQIIAEIEAMGLTPVIEDKGYTKSDMVDSWLRMYNVKNEEELWEQVEGLVVAQLDIHSMDALIEYNWTEIFNGGEDGIIPLQNILVKLDAPGTERGIMFVAHYDSVPTGPGAADAMVCVCAMLEALRAQASNNSLKTDIYFLFTDGEELGLLGAYAFVGAHPELKNKIDMVVNLEARGNRGGLLLFETSPKAYSLMKAAKKSGAKPIGMSLMAAVYAMMPNDTDLTAFLNEGYNGINFAVGEGVKHYHMPTDNYENLNKNTAWQYLKTTLALADYTANNNIDELQKPSADAVFFPFLPGVLVLMTSMVSHVLCALSCILALVFIVREIKNKRLKILKTILMGLLILLSIGSAAFFVAVAYLFYIPLLVMAITLFLKKQAVPYIAAKIASGIVVLLLWVPVLFLLWVMMVQPMML